MGLVKLDDKSEDADLVGMYYKYSCRFELRCKTHRANRVPKLRCVAIRVFTARGINLIVATVFRCWPRTCKWGLSELSHQARPQAVTFFKKEK